MSANATYTGAFADGLYAFRLGIDQLVEHDRLCDAGPEFCMEALYGSSWRVPYVRETIRLGLIGGGTDPMTALALAAAYCGPGQLVGCKALAISILGAALVGAPDEDDPTGEAQGEDRTEVDSSPEEG